MDLFKEPTPPVIPDHQLLHTIGEGSYGEIWLARNVFGVYRAVKVVHRSSFKDEKPYEREFQGIRRFEPISRSHRGLVDVLQVGRNDEAGYFYYIMELADDVDATRQFDPETYTPKTLARLLQMRGRLPAAEAVELGSDLAAALAFLHQHDLVHRDIKPSNIIFVNAEPKLADIGLVASTTAASSWVGTPGFMPPEGPGKPTADIFSLGKVLYELTTGQSPEDYPTLPTNLSEFADYVAVVELNEIFNKACANDPAKRYQTAEAMRSDLEMLRAGESVRRLRFVERQLRTIKRVAVAVAVLAIMALGFGLFMRHLRAREEKLAAAQFISNAEDRVRRGDLHEALPLYAEALRLQNRDADAAATSRTRLGTLLQQLPALLHVEYANQRLSDVRFSADGKTLLLGGGRRAWLMDWETGATLESFPVEHMIETAVFGPDGQRIVLAGDKKITVIHQRTNVVTYNAPSKVYSAEFSPKGEWLAVPAESGKVHVLSVEDGTLYRSLEHSNTMAVSAVFSPDNKTLLSTTWDGGVQLWNFHTGESLGQYVHGNTIVFGAAFSPDGRTFATSSEDRTVRVWNLEGGLAFPTRMDHSGPVRRVNYSPDGRYLVSASLDETVRIWDAHTGRSVESTLNMHQSAMQAMFDPSGQRIAVVGAGGEIRVWKSRAPRPLFLGPRSLVSGDGHRYITVSSNTAQLWNAHDDTPLSARFTADGEIGSVLLSHDGERVVAQTKHGKITRIQAFGPGVERDTSFDIVGSGGRRWLNAEGTRLAVATGSDLYLWNTLNGSLIFGPVSPLTNSISRLAFGADGKMLAVITEKKLPVVMLDARNGEIIGTPLAPEHIVRGIEFSPDSRWLASATGSGAFEPSSAQLWNVATGARLAVMPHARGLHRVHFSHRGEMLVTVGADDRVGVWRASDGAHILEHVPLLFALRSARFSHDDRWFVTTTREEAQVWEVPSGRAITPPLRDVSSLTNAGFCANNQRVWVESRRGLLIWDLPRTEASPGEVMALSQRLGTKVPKTLNFETNAFTAAQFQEHCTAARTSLNVEAWHREQLEECEVRKNWFAAEFHLQRLIHTNPNDLTLQTRWTAIQDKLTAAESNTP